MRRNDVPFLLAFVAIFSLMCFLSCAPVESDPTDVRLRIEVVQPGLLEWDSTYMDWGTVARSEFVLMRNTVRNAGQTPASGAVSLASAAEAVFTITQGAGPFTLQPGDSLVVEVLGGSHTTGIYDYPEGLRK